MEGEEDKRRVEEGKKQEEEVDGVEVGTPQENSYIY